MRIFDRIRCQNLQPRDIKWRGTMFRTLYNSRHKAADIREKLICKFI